MTELLSIVVPTYNEEGNVLPLYKRVAAVLEAQPDLEWELIFALDAPTDRTPELIVQLRERDLRVKMVRLSRRFGQPMATLAGLSYASGDATVVMDCDLQDPPELIPALVERWHEGYDVVSARRSRRAGETLLRRVVAWAGYRVIARISEVDIPPDTGDYRLLSRRVVDNVLSLTESHGFLRGLVALVGFSQTTVPYDRAPRASGRSSYSRLYGSLRIGLNGIVGFSRYPLQLISLAGIVFAMLAFLLAVAYAVAKIGGVGFPIGNPTIVIVVAFFSGIQMLSLGVIGEYVGRIYDEARHRPKFIVESTYGLESQQREPIVSDDSARLARPRA
jgi:dolichol-phosphate mannosyltransferase